MTNIEIKKVTENEVEKLRQIGMQTFLETFEKTNSEENMKSYVKEGFSTEKLTSELKNENSEFYFAQFGEEIIGYLKLNFGDSQTELKDKKSLEIERIYVQKKFYGKSVGQILYDKALQVAKRMNADYVWLGVWEENPRAMSFYKKNGFKAFDKHIFKLGTDEQTDIMMKLELQ